MESHRRDLESQLNWCWHWYLLRVWQECGSFDSASNIERLQVAGEMRADAEGRSKEWALTGVVNLVHHLIQKLDDPDPLVRQEAAISIGDHCPKDHHAVDVLIQRLHSSDQTLHDRTCAAWALGNIGAKSSEVIPILLRLIDEVRDQPDADEFRRFAAKAIKNLTVIGSEEVE